ncbi:MAG: lipase family protein [Promethearchaeota archaeon]
MSASFEVYNPKFNKDNGPYDPINLITCVKFLGGDIDEDLTIQGFYGESNDKKTLFIVYRGTDAKISEWLNSMSPVMQSVQRQSLEDRIFDLDRNYTNNPISLRIKKAEEKIVDATNAWDPIADPERTQRRNENLRGDFREGIVNLINNAAIHKRYWQMYTIKEKVNQQVHNIIENSQNRYDEIVITGHSLGGSLAIICAWDVFTKFPEYDGKIICVPFANPRSCNKELAQLLRYCIPDLHRFVYGNDSLAKLLPRIFGIRHAGIFYHIGSKKRVRLFTRLEHH